jgi:hypothetical protein
MPVRRFFSESRFSAFACLTACREDTASIAMNSAVRRIAKIAQYVPEGTLARTEG